MVTSVVGLLLRSCALCRLGAALDALALVQVHHADVPSASPPTQQAGDTPTPALVKEAKMHIWALKATQYNSAEGVAKRCSALNRIVLSNHLIVERLITAGVPDMIGQSMLRFPTDREMQLACLQLATGIAANSRAAARAELVYVLEPVLAAVERFAATDPWVMASLALLQDNCYRNKESMQKLHAIKRVTVLADKNYRPDVEAEAQCFFSSACGDGHQTATLANEGYIPRALKAMASFQGAEGAVVGARVLAVLAGCFLDRRAYLASMVKGGIIELLFQVLRNATGGLPQDDVDRSNLIISSIEVIEALARTDTTWRERLLNQGAIQITSDLLSKETRLVTAAEWTEGASNPVGASGGDGGSAPMVTGCPTALNIGRPPVLLSRTCRALASLTDSGKNSGMRAAARTAGLLRRIRALLKGKSTVYDPEALRACAPFSQPVAKAELPP